MDRTKKELRERILTLLKNQREEKRLEKSLSIKEKLFNLREFKEARTILFYAAFDGEVETKDMIEQAQAQGKRVALPRINKKDKHITPILMEHAMEKLAFGSYGIKEPAPHAQTLHLEEIDMIVVPGIAFDRHGNRLGRGRGYYDRFLDDVSPHVPTVGLAFDFQVVDAIPYIKDHDRAVSRLITA